MPIRWHVDYDTKNVGPNGQAPLSTLHETLEGQLEEVRRRLWMIRGPLLACKLFNRLAQRRFERLPFSGRWSHYSAAVVLPNVDIFHPSWSIFTLAPFPEVDPSVPLIQPGELLTTVHHLQVGASRFSRTLARGTCRNQPLSTFSSLRDITLLVNNFHLPLMLQNMQPAPDGTFSMMGPGIPELRMTEADLGHLFVEYWHPFANRGVRLFVQMFRKSQPTFELFVTPSGIRLRLL